MRLFKLYISVLLGLVLFTSCDKGYDLRFVNFYLEPMDSVIVGSDVLVFTNIETQSSSAFMKIKKGTYGVRCISKTKKQFSTEINIPSKGSGQRSLQIDGLATFVLLEE
jgi:hypothetical protein